MKATTWLAWGTLLCTCACSRTPAGPPALPPTPQVVAVPRAKQPKTGIGTAAKAASAAACGKFGTPQRLGKISKHVREASGLVQSQRDPTVLWTHNDGTEGQLYGLSLPKGKIVAKVTLSGPTAVATDWEELSDGPCGAKLGGGKPSARCLIIGDTGDNHGGRLSIAFHRLREPDPRGGVQRITRFETMRARYPKKAFNSEAFVMDNAGVIWLWTKADKHTRLFRVPFVPGSAKLEPIAKIKSARAMGVSKGHGARLTAAAWDHRANRLLLRSYDAVWELCLGNAGLRAMPTARWLRVDVAHEKQGEAIAIGGGGFFHVSEGKHAHVYRVPRR